MIRVKIRSFGEATGKVLRFDESIGYHSLLRKIINKLGTTTCSEGVDGPQISEIDDDDLSKLFQLRLGGDSVLEDTNEVEHGDDLVLMRLDNDIDDDDDEKNDNEVTAAKSSSQKRKRATSSTTKSSVKKEPDNDDDDDEEENLDSKPAAKICQESESTDSEDEVQEIKKENIPVDDHDVISISSDSDEDESSMEEEEESDYWEEGEEEEEEDSSDEEDEDFDDEAEAEAEAEDIPDACTSKRPSKKRKRNPKPTPESPLEVIMEEKDVPSAPGKHDDDEQEAEKDNEASPKDDLEEVSLLVNKGAGKKKADRVVKDRIIKLLNTGFHDQSNEHEAKNAMKLAQRLMRKHNLSQALLLKEREAKNDQNEQGGDEVLKGGMVRVHIINRKTGKPSLFARWISQLTHPVCENFDVKSYNQTRRGFRCDVVFYGIYSNAQLAGYAFKVAAERIAQMSAEYKPKTISRGISTKSSRLSYALGIVQGISEDVKKNLQMEKEKSKRKLERARLAGSKGEAYEESDDEEEEEDTDHEAAGYSFPKNDDGGKSDSNKMDSNEMPPDTCSSNLNGREEDSKPKPISGFDLQSRVKELEEEQQAALVLVNHNEKIAEEVLKEHDIKLSSGRKRKAIDFDRHSYNRGIEDAKEIDMNQRAIRDDVKVKKEKQENT
jgi:hypothetical protein